MAFGKIRIDPNDSLFSKLIRARDGKCVFCGKSDGKLENSHFWGRGNKSTRFDPKNCDTLCFRCHMENESNKQGFYRTWKIEQLGEDGYQELEQRARGFAKYGKYEKELVKKHLKEHGLENYDDLYNQIKL